jgi:hypothetical protein
MEKKTNSGLVKNIDFIYSNLNMITLFPLSGGEEKIPFYGTIGRGYIGKFITITSRKKGLFRKEFNQTIEGPSSHASITLPYSLVEVINNNYRWQSLDEELREMLNSNISGTIG